jgi:hypothetical protein
LLHAAGLPELVAGSPAAYESMGLRLAREPALRQALRHTLFRNRLNSPLFDIARYTRHYEAALTQMRETRANSHEPASFAVPPSLLCRPVPAAAPIEGIAAEANVRALKQLGYTAHCPPIEELDHSARYSVISMTDVLEHMPFPKTGLAAAHWVLRPDGVLFLSRCRIWTTWFGGGCTPTGSIPIGARSSIITIFPVSGFTHSCNSTGLSSPNITSANATASSWRSSRLSRGDGAGGRDG